MVSPVPSPSPDDLFALRERLDVVDRDLHRLLRERFAIAETIGMTKGPDEPIIRPDREVEVVANRLRLHEGAMPRDTLVHIWRVLIGGACAVQRPYTIHVSGTLEAARYLYGPVTIVRWPTASEALGALADGSGDVAVLSDAERWWDEPVSAHAFARFELTDGSRITLLGGSGVGTSNGPRALAVRNDRLHECDVADLSDEDDILGRFAPSPFTIPVAQ
ncbi:chorismate mutase [Acuticoccus sediminis]|uniref:chorismate mutase n=1 Tax=Acuticoccus sediminis TaxID=2184697 RepID=UPI001CFD5D85|nr:chorismate mutase [Acuticoccus sediminis]